MSKVAIITTSWDDGHPLDLELAKLLKKYNLPATFYMSLENQERKTLTLDQIKQISQDFDVGGHTYSHVDLTKLTGEKIYGEITKGKKCLETIIGRQICSFCYPWGMYDEEIVNMVKKAGFEGARTIKLLERKATTPFEMGTTIHVGERGISHFMNFVKRSKILPNMRMPLYLLTKNLLFKDWFEAAMDSLDFVLKDGGIFHLWGHSWEIDKGNHWEKLNLIFERIFRESKGSRKTFLMDNTEVIHYLLDSNGTRKKYFKEMEFELNERDFY